MTIRFLINDDGSPFEASELRTLRGELDALDNAGRTEYRNNNASEIAQHGATKFLIVSGPGTGKSHLFLDRIDHWYQQDQGASVVVTSFVRKLVADLQNDIERDEKLTAEQKDKITVSTLHKFARSIVEKNHGTTEWPFSPHFRIIGQFWKEVVWGDVLAFYPDLDRGVFTWKKFEEQLHDSNFEESDEWQELKETYFKLCRFYNAAGFADLILRATKALAEDPGLNEDKYFIIDEYQDFNLAEEALINQLVDNPKGLLVVGDDEQVLYEKLKSGKPTLIRNLYKDKVYAKGMLPFCSRSSFHITKAADHFIQQHRETDCIAKIYLPLMTNSDEPKVQVIACATPQTAVDYIEKFVADNKAEIDERKGQLEADEPKDAYLLILTPAKEVNFYRESKDKIKRIVSEYQTETRSFSEDYYQLLSYYSLANNPNNNFTFRKVLYYEGVSEEKVHKLIARAMQDDKCLWDLDFQEIKDALAKCSKIKTVLDGERSAAEKVDQISRLISVADREKLQSDMERKAISQGEVVKLEHEEEEEAELEEIEVKKMGAVELMTIVGSKGLSADHVIIIGFDDVNMKWVTKNAFYVALTRARKSLHILTALKSGGATKAHSFLKQLPDAHLEFYSYRKSDHTKRPLDNRHALMDYLYYIHRQSRRSRQR
ncbi:MAG TPA: ATP-dependent helicase [Candidatus Cloacimonetes bacterium]|nr:ATP-dependent helicase [Candidatus Cloacimonadota bacterium]HEX37310.1 ATP-dependent helicase [Candidatus Cloacimonadota bacterium]